MGRKQPFFPYVQGEAAGVCNRARRLRLASFARRTARSGNAPWGEPRSAARGGGKGGVFEDQGWSELPTGPPRASIAGQPQCREHCGRTRRRMLLVTFGETKVTPPEAIRAERDKRILCAEGAPTPPEAVKPPFWRVPADRPRCRARSGWRGAWRGGRARTAACRRRARRGPAPSPSRTAP